MASSSSSITLLYRIIDNQNNILLATGIVHILSNAYVAELKHQVCTKNEGILKPRGIDPSRLSLWKLSTLLPTGKEKTNLDIEFPDPGSDEALEGNGTVQILDPFGNISRYWQEDPEEGHLHLVVQVLGPDISAVTHAPMMTYKKRRLEVEDGAAKRPGPFAEAQARDVEMAQRAPTPSSAAAMPTFLKQQTRRPVLNGRPYNNYGLPVGLFHPVFDSFQAAMKEDVCYPDAETYASVKELFVASADIYMTEDRRISAINRHLAPLLGSEFTNVRAPYVESDGVIVQRCNLFNAYLVIREVKNEIGMARSDPYNEGSLSYRRYWADEEQDIARSKSHCPSFILAIAGPWLCVLGGVYSDKAIVQPLTDYLWLGGDVFSDDRLLSISRLFTALKSSISELRKYYKSLSNVIGDRPDGFPFVRNYQTETFSYISTLAEDHPDKLIYKARDDQSGRLLVVKFVSTYHAQAHRLLAENQLAPALHYAGTEDAKAQMYGGRYMVVMDFVDTARSFDYHLSEDQIAQVRRAVDLLHSRNLVFGDLRLPNILIVAGTSNVMIIDFNWCSQADEGRYPASLNQESDIDWAEGVGPSCIMRKQHDLDMLKKLY
ncbi:hypothetical protein M0805_001392 [Coniferiporia weirii]|nr:hypothetical protein M0805_001392 [Coniferiporia weirii]